jgi:hypothetical protein
VINAHDLKVGLTALDYGEYPWALILEHVNGELEIHGWDSSASVLLVPLGEGSIRDALVSPEPVPCDVAAGAEVFPLNECERCEGV